jgi:hypothetical protein
VWLKERIGKKLKQSQAQFSFKTKKEVQCGINFSTNLMYFAVLFLVLSLLYTLYQTIKYQPLRLHDRKRDLERKSERTKKKKKKKEFLVSKLFQSLVPI